MSSQEANVEQIVQLVLARLRERESAERRARPLTEAAGTGSGRELAIHGRLVTEFDLAQQLNGETVVRVSRTTVVTPAARDFLNQRGVRLERNSGPADRHRANPPVLAVGVAETRFEPGGLLAGLARQGAKIEQLARVGLIGVTDSLAERVARGGERGLLFCQRPFAALCLANRRSGVRAAEVRRVDEVKMALAEIGANLLVVNPRGPTMHTLLEIVRTYLSAPPAECPVELRERLNQ